MGLGRPSATTAAESTAPGASRIWVRSSSLQSENVVIAALSVVPRSFRPEYIGTSQSLRRAPAEAADAPLRPWTTRRR